MATDPSGITADDQVARIFEWRRGFNTIHLIDLGLKLGLFQALAESPGLTSDVLADKLSLKARHVRVWCWTAHSAALLDADDQGAFRLAPHIDAILAKPTHPRFRGGYVQLGVDVAAEDFRRSVDAFRTGENRPFQGRGDDFARAIAGATWGLQIATAKKILPGLPDLAARLEAGGTILEVGCGTGNFLVQALKAFPRARVIGADLDRESLAIARQRLADAGIQDRATLIEGPLEGRVPDGSLDACVMIEVLHEIAATIRPAVVAETAKTLKAGGWYVIVDETYPSTLAQSREAAYLFPVQTGFEELTWGNDIPDRAEQERLLREAGLREPFDRMLIGEGFTVLCARRP